MMSMVLLLNMQHQTHSSTPIQNPRDHTLHCALHTYDFRGVLQADYLPTYWTSPSTRITCVRQKEMQVPLYGTPHLQHSDRPHMFNIPAQKRLLGNSFIGQYLAKTKRAQRRN